MNEEAVLRLVEPLEALGLARRPDRFGSALDALAVDAVAQGDARYRSALSSRQDQRDGYQAPDSGRRNASRATSLVALETKNGT